jgi:nucleotide-binding universal stress UspA family protein
VPVPVSVPEGATYIPPSTANAEEKIAHLLHADVLQGVDVEWAVRLGLPAEVIIDEARDRSADLIVTGTHGFSGVKHFLLGSVAEELARSAPCPVITVGPHVDKRFSRPGKPERILVPVDFSPESLDVLPYVIALMKEFAPAVTFLHVRDGKEEKMPRAQSKHFIGKMRRMLSRHVPKGCDASYLVESGDVSDTVLAIAHQTWSDIIAMGVRSRQEAGFRIRSSVTYKVMAAAQCPVLISHLH